MLSETDNTVWTLLRFKPSIAASPGWETPFGLASFGLASSAMDWAASIRESFLELRVAPSKKD
jgi:hypothetical protein